MRRLLLVLLLLSCSAFARTETGFLNRILKLEGKEYRYQVYLPPDYSKDKKWPVILFLHGAGERGSDGLFQTEVGIGRGIRSHVERFPAIVVLPQCPLDVWWPAELPQKIALGALEAAIKEFKGDRERLYLTGLSMGGYGTWTIAANNPGKFAALAPICGGVYFPNDPKRGKDREAYKKIALAIGHTPVWIFHGNADPAVPVDESRIMYEEVKAAGGNVHYYEYDAVGHESWNPAYDDPDLEKWLFSWTAATAKNAPAFGEMRLIPKAQ